MLWVKVLVAFMAAPGLVDVLLPAFILWKTGALRLPGMGVLQIVGLLFFAAGVAVLAWVFHAFVHYGHGTPAPFDPPHQFMRQGLYLWVRNPMVLAAVVLIPLGEALFFESWFLVGYMALLILTMHLYLVFIEEKELERRFGRPYQKYKRTVPRWIPRRPRD
jgi:protein-S-isoprenylcysteine O-methyltransferase Ste14